MKTLFAIILLAIGGFTSAATLTIEIPAADEQRIYAAYGDFLGLGKPATLEDVQRNMIYVITTRVQNYERKGITPAPLKMQPTPAPTAKPTAAPKGK